MIKRMVILGAALLLSLSAQATEQQLPVHDRFKLANGLQVEVLQERRAPLVVTQVWYRVGSIDEQPGVTGISHILEHMMFQGTEKMAPEAYSKQIALHGGSDNAATSRDATYYYSKLAKQHLPLALELEADRMRNLRLSQQEYAPENKVVQEERRMRVESQPGARMMESFRKKLYGEHPYGRPIIGSMEDIQGIELADLRNWYEKFYAPNNAILVIAGDVEFAEVRRLVERTFGPLKANPAIQAPHNPPWQIERKRDLLDWPDEEVRRASWIATWLAPTLLTAEGREDAYALEVMAALLDQGSSSRLQQLVTGDGVAVSASAGYRMLGRGPSTVTLNAMPRRGVSMDQLEKAMMAEVTKLKTGLADARELRKVKNQLLAANIYARDSIHAMARFVGRLSSLGMDWAQYLTEAPGRIEAVTAEQIRDVAQRYLKEERPLIGILRPAEKKSVAKGEAS
uniref:Putative Zn-dependent protease n=1 Tax=Magnetococcus massalia (strain MO-1) TaxID=451514 RepID=A0A1S7LFV5_MAGMO|nr:putative Zn-dependent protease [Candidatus Magnetococcus massalia]